MAARTMTGAMETDAEPERILAILKDPGRIPEWASNFADRIEPAGNNAWTVTKDGAEFRIRVVVGDASRTVDYLRPVAPDREGGAFLRVLARPGGGSVVVMTLPVPPGADAGRVGVVLYQELEALVRLSSSRTV